jgi:hypothetical protein
VLDFLGYAKFHNKIKQEWRMSCYTRRGGQPRTEGLRNVIRNKAIMSTNLAQSIQHRIKGDK